MPSVVLVIAHPDDESVGAATRLKRWCPLRLMYVTDGAPRNMRDARACGFRTREAYAAARAEELARALAVAGIERERVRLLGFVDQEASFHLPTLARGLADAFHALRPGVVMTHAYEGGHPDHDATVLAIHAACRLLRRDGAAAPAIVEMTSYHRRNGAMTTCEFLPDAQRPVTTIELTDAEQQLKRAMFECFWTQRTTLGAFRLDCERFRLAPRYDLAAAPHAGRLHYEHFDWGMTGPRWRRLAAEALDTLRLRGRR